MKTLVILPNLEVRLKSGITHGLTEDLLYRAHTGSTSELVDLMATAELLRLDERRKAAEGLAEILSQRIRKGFGNIIEVDIVDGLREWHENELL